MRLGDIAERIGAGLRGSPDIEITRPATLQAAGPGCISFLANARYQGYLDDCAASAVILNEDMAGRCPVAALVVADPYMAWAETLDILVGDSRPQAGVHASACVHESVRMGRGVSVAAGAVIDEGVIIGDNAVIGPNVSIGPLSSVGNNCRLAAGVVIYHGVLLGENVIVHANAVIGADGFGFAERGDGSWRKVIQAGSVRIGSDVEIGANTTIDRGAVEDTVIEHGVKLDNQIQVAHNVHIGADTAIAGCVGIAGSACIGQRCRIGGGAGILGHLEIGDDVTITAMTLVTRSLAGPGVYSSAVSAQETPAWRRNNARLHRLDELARRVTRMERENKKG